MLAKDGYAYVSISAGPPEVCAAGHGRAQVLRPPLQHVGAVSRPGTKDVLVDGLRSRGGVRPRLGGHARFGQAEEQSGARMHH